jgi:hypothetical protein
MGNGITLTKVQDLCGFPDPSPRRPGIGSTGEMESEDLQLAKPF